MFDLSGRVALVTGAGYGVGSDIAARLAGQGASVAVNDVRSDRAAATAAAIVKAGRRAAAVAFDVTDGVAVGAGIAAVVAALGPVDILINSAASGALADGTAVAFRDMDPSDWIRAIDVSLFGVLQCTRAVIDGMCEQGWGRVITISSDSAVIGMAGGVSLDGAGKGAAVSFMRHLSQEVASSGVTVNTLVTGHMSPPDRAIPSRPAADRDERETPDGAGRGEDVGAACVYLASDESARLTGQTIHINGGQSTT